METQFTDIRVRKENLRDIMHGECGGGYRKVDVEIVVDSKQPFIMQREAVIHETLGLYLGSVVHNEILEQIAMSIAEGLDALERDDE